MCSLQGSAGPFHQGRGKVHHRGFLPARKFGGQLPQMVRRNLLGSGRQEHTQLQPNLRRHPGRFPQAGGNRQDMLPSRCQERLADHTQRISNMHMQAVRKGNHPDCQAQEEDLLQRCMPPEMVGLPIISDPPGFGCPPPLHLLILPKALYSLRQSQAQVLQP